MIPVAHVYVLTSEPFHDNSEVLGAFRSLTTAKDKVEGATWQKWEGVVGGNSRWVTTYPDDSGQRDYDHSIVTVLMSGVIPLEEDEVEQEPTVEEIAVIPAALTGGMAA